MKIKKLQLLIVYSFVLVGALNGCTPIVQETTLVEPIVNGGTCPLPPALSKTDSENVKKFGAEVTGIVKAVAGVKGEADIEDKVKRDFPGASEVNKIAALSFAACMACRLQPGEVKACGELFKTIIDKTPRTEARRSSAKQVEEYSDRVLGSLLK